MIICRIDFVRVSMCRISVGLAWRSRDYWGFYDTEDDSHLQARHEHINIDCSFAVLELYFFGGLLWRSPFASKRLTRTDPPTP